MPDFHHITTVYSPPLQNGTLEKTIYGNSTENGRFTSKKRFQPAHGKEFEIDSVPAIEAKTKGFIVRVVISAALVALLVTGIYGLLHQKYGPLVSTWAVVGPIVGAMITHYFGGHRKDSG